MKLYLTFILISLFLTTTSQASTTAPMFAGSSLVIPGVATYTWLSATEDGTQHVDTYKYTVPPRAIYYVTVTGLIAYPNGGLVSGTKGSTVIDGYVQSDGVGGITYGNRVQTGATTESLTFNSRNYTATTANTTTYSLSPTAGLVSTTVQGDTTYSGAAGSFSVAADGTISGSETGFYVDGHWCVNSTMENDIDLTLATGHHYDKSYLFYSRYGSGPILISGSIRNSDSTLFVSLAVNTLYGSDTGVWKDGVWYVNHLHDGSTVDYTSPDGRHYAYHAMRTMYSFVGSGNVTSSDWGNVTSNEWDYYSDDGESDYDGNGLPGYSYFTIDPNGIIDGFEHGVVSGGIRYVNHADSTAVDLTLASGRHYTTHVVTSYYSPDGNGGVTTNVTENYYDDAGHSFSLGSDNRLYGDESGVMLNGAWYVDNDNISTADMTLPNGHHYTSHKVHTSYVSDGNGGVTTLTSSSYSDSSGNTIYVGSDGSISGYEQGVVINGILYMSGQLSSQVNPSGMSSITVFGDTYNFNYGGTYGYLDDNGNPVSSGWSATFTVPFQANSVTIYSTWSASDSVTHQAISGWNQYAGSFSGEYTSDLSGLTWQPRTAAAFAPAQLYLNNALMNWQSGSITTDGVITDTYTNAQSSGQILTISGPIGGFLQGSSSATVSVDGSGIGTLAASHIFTITGWDIQTAAPNQTTPLFAPATLWVDGTPYAFAYGCEDTSGNRSDIYLTSGGAITLAGNSANLTTANVLVTHNGSRYSGTVTFSSGADFTVAGVDMTAVAPGSGPPAFWVGDVFYLPASAGSNNYTSFPTGNDTLILGGAGPTGLLVSGSHSGTAMTGTYDPAAGGSFTLTQNDGSALAACPAMADGRQIPAGTAPTDFPPALHIGSGVWSYLGTATDDEASGTTSAYYGNSRTPVFDTSGPLIPGSHRSLLKIRLDGSGVVTLTNYGSGVDATGTYSTTTHLFQTGTSNSLPMPIYGVDPNANDTAWPQIQRINNSPATMLVGGDMWRYVGPGQNGAALYQGYYGGQQLILGASNPGGVRMVTVTDPIHGNTTGTYSDATGIATLSNQQQLQPGTPNGTQLQPSNLATLGGDLDVPGNLITLGSLNGDAGSIGATLQFSDIGSQAVFGTALGRKDARWMWWRVNPTDSTSFVPTMALDSSKGLYLYDPSTADPGDDTTAAVKLSPSSGTFSELPKLKLTSQTLDDTDATKANVITRELGDARYLRSSGGGSGSLTLSGGLNIYTGTGGTNANTVATDAAAIGQNLQAASGQVVVGKYNAPNTSDVFTVGAGTATDSLKNALSVSDAGDTTVAGNLAVAGTIKSGSNSVAQYSASLALGDSARAKGAADGSEASIAIGTGAASGYSVSELGRSGEVYHPDTWTGGPGGVAMGANVIAGPGSAAIGPEAKARSQSVALGYKAQAYGDSSFSVGYKSMAAGYNAVAIGTQSGSNGENSDGVLNPASGNNSVSLGAFSHGVGAQAIGIGDTWADGENAIAIGTKAITAQSNTVAIGRYALANFPNQVALGAYNDPGTSTSSATDPIFVIGNGASETQRSNAFLVKRNGDALVFGALKVNNQSLDDDTSVITRELGDARYLRSSGGGSGSLTLSGGLNIFTGTGGSNANTVASDAAAIGQNLQATSGQVVVGRNNAAASDAVFVVGAGTSAATADTKNAISVSTGGDTTMNGNLSVCGTLSVNGSPVSTQAEADTRYYQKGQVIRQAPAGDVEMSDEFRSIPPNVTVPGLPPP